MARFVLYVNSNEVAPPLLAVVNIDAPRAAEIRRLANLVAANGWSRLVAPDPSVEWRDWDDEERGDGDRVPVAASAIHVTASHFWFTARTSDQDADCESIGVELSELDRQPAAPPPSDDADITW